MPFGKPFALVPAAMASLNKVMLIGNLTRDPELRYTPKGMAVTEIGLAVNRTYSVENEKREEVTFIDVTFWGKGAEIIAQYMKKGRPLYVEGRLRLDSWDDKTTGQKRSRLTVTGEEFQFLGSRDGAGGGGGEGNYDGGQRSSSGAGNYGGGSGGSGGYTQNRPPQQQPRPQQGGYGSPGASERSDPQEEAPPPRSTGNNPRPDAFPSGLDDDEIPF